MKSYRVKKGKGIKLLLVIFALLPLLIYLIEKPGLDQKLWLILLSIIPFVVVSWVFFGTSYWIDNHRFHYRSGFLKGNLDIHQISQVEMNKTLWSGLKPAMASNGMIIKMKYDEIYVAPEDDEEMIGDFLRINPEIKYRQNKETDL
jgi:hypothetical protein